MKIGIIAGAVIFSLVPAASHAAVNWTSQNYHISTYNDLGIPVEYLNTVHNISGLPISHSESLSENGAASSAHVAIEKLVNPAADTFRFILNANTIAGSGQYSNTIGYAYLDNAFLADGPLLNIGYDFNASMQLQTGVRGFAYQDLAIEMILEEAGNPSSRQTLSLVDYVNETLDGAGTVFHPFSGSGTRSFSLVQGRSYSLKAGITYGDGYAEGPVPVNALLSQMTFSVTVVPEPETYAMMLAGLGLMGLVGWRRKTV